MFMIFGFLGYQSENRSKQVGDVLKLICDPYKKNHGVIDKNQTFGDFHNLGRFFGQPFRENTFSETHPKNKIDPKY